MLHAFLGQKQQRKIAQNQLTQKFCDGDDICHQLSAKNDTFDLDRAITMCTCIMILYTAMTDRFLSQDLQMQWATLERHSQKPRTRCAPVLSALCQRQCWSEDRQNQRKCRGKGHQMAALAKESLVQWRSSAQHIPSSHTAPDLKVKHSQHLKHVPWRAILSISIRTNKGEHIILFLMSDMVLHCHRHLPISRAKARWGTLVVIIHWTQLHDQCALYILSHIIDNIHQLYYTPPLPIAVLSSLPT